MNGQTNLQKNADVVLKLFQKGNFNVISAYPIPHPTRTVTTRSSKFDEEAGVELAAGEVVGDGVLLVGDVGDPEVGGDIVQAKDVEAVDAKPDVAQVLAEAATKLFKEVLVEASQSSTVAEQLRQKVGANPHEAQGVNVFGISGDDGLPQEATVDKEISDAMVSGSFDALGDDIATTDPNSFDETAMGFGSSELDTSGNELNPDDWAAEEPAPEEGATEGTSEEGNEVEGGTEPVAEEGGIGEETNTADEGGGLETLDL